eukprot:scaffold2093_cov425-Prasinococcus_capsulatus_cf.AAC.14
MFGMRLDPGCLVGRQALRQGSHTLSKGLSDRRLGYQALQLPCPCPTVSSFPSRGFAVLANFGVLRNVPVNRPGTQPRTAAPFHGLETHALRRRGRDRSDRSWGHGQVGSDWLTTRTVSCGLTVTADRQHRLIRFDTIDGRPRRGSRVETLGPQRVTERGSHRAQLTRWVANVHLAVQYHIQACVASTLAGAHSSHDFQSAACHQGLAMQRLRPPRVCRILLRPHDAGLQVEDAPAAPPPASCAPPGCKGLGGPADTPTAGQVTADGAGLQRGAHALGGGRSSARARMWPRAVQTGSTLAALLRLLRLLCRRGTTHPLS